MFAQTLNLLRMTIDFYPLGPVLVKAGEELSDTTPSDTLLTQTPGEQIQEFRRYKEFDQKRRAHAKEKNRQQRERHHKLNQEARQQERPLPVVPEFPPSMQFVRTQRNNRKEPYLPGSSLKGVLRSDAERLARSMTLDGLGACNPLAGLGASSQTTAVTEKACWSSLGDPDEKEKAWLAVEVYPRLCAACKLFGSPFLAGRLQISDAYLVQTDKPKAFDPLPRRDGVGIDRQRGAAADRAKYDFEYWDGNGQPNGGAFRAHLYLRNFELWQVGWLAHLFYSWEQGALHIGFGTRRGLGRMRAVVTELELSYFGRLALARPSSTLPLMGLGALMADTSSPANAALAAYGFVPQPVLELSAGFRLLTNETLALQRTWRIETPAVLWDKVGPLWTPALVAQVSV